MNSNSITEQTESEQIPESGNGQALKANKRKRIITCVFVTLSVIVVAALLGVILGMAILDIII